MPPSSKRSQRARRTRDASPSPPPEQSSPSRPTKRRKKVEEPISEPMEDETSSLTVDNSTNEVSSDNDRLITLVTQHLRTLPSQASRDHANSIHEAKTDIEAFGTISAHDWTYYIKLLSINIGRASEPTPSHPSVNDPEDEDFVHIDLGPAKTFSRQTAVIYYDSDLGRWFIEAKGRNGLKIDNVSLKKSDDPSPLSSGQVIEINGIEMMFVLPASAGPVQIHPMYLERAGIKPAPSSPARDTSRTALPRPPSNTSQSATRPSSSRGQSFQQPIAPAPPDYRRPGTPPSAKSRPTTSQAKTPAHGSSGTVIMSQNDIDLSKDENRHIKPHFSYAQMITQAIMSTTEEKLNLAGIYQYITTHYAYYRHQPAAGWQNSIRHNLSLNKSFSKAPRTTDEPGKGMKWEIVPETRDEMIRSAYKGGRGGHRGSSVPSSPQQPSQLSYLALGAGDLLPRKRKASVTASPPPKSSLNLAHVTPDRKRLPIGSASFQEGSPLPRRKNADAENSFGTADTLPNSPPTLSSSFFQDESASFVTPAPLRVHPRLAPPSTAQRPSQHMPTSSPAPFWKYADLHSTPLKYDVSPSKTLGLPGSSSPPAANDRSPAASPTRSTGSTRAGTQEHTTVMDDDEEEGGFDLTKGFQSIGSYHAPINTGNIVPQAHGSQA